MVGRAVPARRLTGRRDCAPYHLTSWSKKGGASAAEHKSVALAKHLPPLGVYKNDVKVGVYKNLPIYTAKTSVAIRDIRGEAKQHTKEGNKNEYKSNQDYA